MLDTEQRQEVTYFVGYEVEHTVCFGLKTLFVVGAPPLEEILKHAEENECKHVYFGTSQSYNPKTFDDFMNWDSAIIPLLKKDYWVTLDFDVAYTEQVHESGYCEFNRFIPMISVKLPYINLFNYNTTLKIDDKTWGATNSGVWSVPLNEFKKREYYTHWDQYTKDTAIGD